MIQLRQISKGNPKDDMIELGKILNFLDKENIKYDLEPPRTFVKWETIGSNTYLRTKSQEE